MTDQNIVFLILVLAVIFVGLWTFNTRQKRKHEKARLERKRELETLKANARAAAAEKTND